MRKSKDSSEIGFLRINDLILSSVTDKSIFARVPCGDLPQKKKIQNLVFPSGLSYDKSNGKVRTTSVNSIFSCIPDISRELRETKNGKSVKNNQFSAWVTPARFEPATVTFVV